MRPILFSIGSYAVSSFFFTIMVGVLVTTFYGYWMTVRRGLQREVILDLAIWTFVGGFLGSRIFHILVEYPSYYWEKPSRVFEIWKGGFVSWGFVLSIFILFPLYGRLKKVPIWPYLDIFAISAPIVHFFIRLGCLLTGCCYGKPTDLPWAITFTNPDSTAYYFVGATPLHPTQIYDMLFGLLLFGGLNWFYRRARFAGQTFCVFVFSWHLGRFILEFFRGDADRGIFFGIPTGQIMSALVFMTFLVIYYRLKKHGT